jgi:outer membrane receptor protein involved in Fe transport
MSWVATERASLLGGVVYEQRRTDPYLFRFVDDGSLHPFSAFDHSASAWDLSLYGQGLLTIVDGTDAVIGFRYVEDSDAGSTFLPRLGLVHRLSPSLFVKLLYAEAYRTPDFFETTVKTYGVLFGDPALKPERTENLDLALDATFGDRVNLQLSSFIQRSSDLIEREPTSDPETQGAFASVFTNAGGEEIWGLEASLRAQPSEALRFFANYSFREGRDRRTHEDLDLIARHSANLSLKYRLRSNLSITPSLQLVGHRGTVDDYALLHAVLTWEARPNLALSLIGRNLGNEDYAYPEYIRRNIDSIPAGPERSLFAQLRWRY